MRKAHKERVDRYRKSEPTDQRTDEQIWKCIKEVTEDKRYQTILVNWAVSHCGFSEEELKRGEINIERLGY